jgi:hypothetical protein
MIFLQFNIVVYCPIVSYFHKIGRSKDRPCGVFVTGVIVFARRVAGTLREKKIPSGLLKALSLFTLTTGAFRVSSERVRSKSPLPERLTRRHAMKISPADNLEQPTLRFFSRPQPLCGNSQFC